MYMYRFYLEVMKSSHQDRTICDGVTAFHAAAECLGQHGGGHSLWIRARIKLGLRKLLH